MFALGGWFMALSLKNKSATTVIYDRLVRLLPTWWTFSLFTLIAGFFYSVGAGISLNPSLAWVLPYKTVSWDLDNAYANDATVVTWYIATYLWLMLLSPLLLAAYKKLSWVIVFAPLVGLLLYSHTSQFLPQSAFDVLVFGGCWMLGFAKADGKLDLLPRYIVYLVAAAFSACGILLTYQEQSLGGNPEAQAIFSFGIAMLLLSFNPNLSFLPNAAKNIIRSINTFAVTIYLFHNILIDAAYKVGDYFYVYEFGNLAHIGYSGDIGNFMCFIILLFLIFITVKTVGIVETHRWFQRKESK
jgi:hypothetical protein